MLQLVSEIAKIKWFESREIVRADAVRGARPRENPCVGAAVERDAGEGVPHAVQIFERTGHRPAARAPTQHKRAVDVEKKDGFQT